MKSKLLIMLAATVLLAVLCCAQALATPGGQCGDNVSWTMDPETGVVTISGTGPMWDYDSAHPEDEDRRHRKRRHHRRQLSFR